MDKNGKLWRFLTSCHLRSQVLYLSDIPRPSMISRYFSLLSIPGWPKCLPDFLTTSSVWVVQQWIKCAFQKKKKKKSKYMSAHSIPLTSEHSLFIKLATHFWHSVVIYLLDISKRNCFWRRTSLKVQRQYRILTTVLQFHRHFQYKTNKLHMSLYFHLAKLLHFIYKKVRFQRCEIYSEPTVLQIQ